MRSKLLRVALVVVVLRLLFAPGHGLGAVLAFVLGWLLAIWVLVRAWPACESDVRRLAERFRRRNVSEGF